MAQRLGGEHQAETPDAWGDERTGAPRSTRRNVTLFFAVLVLGLIALAYGYDRLSAPHYFPGTRIGGVSVGSLTLDQAEAKLRDKYVAPLHEHITLEAPEFKAKASPWKMGMRVDVADNARDELLRQQGESVVQRLWHRVAGDSADVRIRPDVDEKEFGAFLKKTFKKVNQDPEDARLDISRDELEVIPHKLGRKVDKKDAESAIFAALTDGAKRVEIPVKVIKPELQTKAFKRVILVSTGSNRLTLYKNGDVSKKYGVATGTGGYPTPHGQFRVTAKRMNPTWYNPNSDWSQNMPAFIPPGPGNPLGTRALNLSASGIRIHGTPDEWSIGSNASHGCIRMRMRDAEDLFERVDVGTPVVIVY